MNTSAPDNFITVPEPLFKYQGSRVVHDDNAIILGTSQTAQILPAQQVKQLKKRYGQLNKKLRSARADDLIQQESALIQDYNSTKLLYAKYKSDLAAASPAQQDALHKLIVTRAAQIKSLQSQITDIRSKLSPLRAAIQEHAQIKIKLTGHYAALDDHKKETDLRKAMAKEAEIIAQQISQTLARLGYKHTYTKGNKTKTDYVQFDHAVVTPDQIQLKISASKQGLFGGSVDLMPQGVFLTEIIQDRVCKELTVALEREVWSPHTSEDQLPLTNGGWYIIERMGNIDGIPRNVTYKQLMARYDTADHKKFPIPAGLKRGRLINWLYLDSPAGIHLMFTGISGSGKSNAMRAMVSAVIETQSPDDIQFVFVDLKKQGDFREFAQAPHCLTLDGTGVLTEIPQVVEMLKRIRSDMHSRQIRIGHITNNLIDYNKRVKPQDKMPRICIVFDEFANTRRSRFSDDSDVIDDICIEIGQVGRAAGISLWLGIQQPRRDNMPSALRDNITTQFVGHQANVGAAQSVTGNRDSLRLEDIPGRMAATVGWRTDKVQMPYISDDDVKSAVRSARAKHGDHQPYTLQSVAETSAQPETGYELVLKTAFEEFDGALKTRPIYEHLKPALSQSKTTEIVKRMIEEGVNYQGRSYHAVKQTGNYYLLVPGLDTSTPDPITDPESSNRDEYEPA